MKIYKPGTILIDTRDNEIVRVVDYNDGIRHYSLDCIRQGNGAGGLVSTLGSTTQTSNIIEQYYVIAESYIVNETLERYERL